MKKYKSLDEHKKQLDTIKENIENSFKYFEHNYKRFNTFKNIVFVSTISAAEESLLNEMNKPKVEFNVLEAYISRLRGQFSKQIPSVKISAKDGKKADKEVIKTVEDHIRYMTYEANKNGTSYDCYTDTLAGGFSAGKVYTEYNGEISFHQDIFLDRCFDPTMTGFDFQNSRKKDKSDGDFCYEIVPFTRRRFEADWPDVKLDDALFNRQIKGFKWAYRVDIEEIILVADYYEKKKVRTKIVYLSDGESMTNDEYKKFLQNWEDEEKIEQPPVIISQRWTNITKIIRYKVIENQIFDRVETDYKRLPLTFIDGNSVLSKQADNGNVSLVTRPIIYNAIGAQKLKNFAGQSLANELENMGPPKMLASKDSIPPQYLEWYLNPQEATIYIYNAFKNDDANVPLAPPEMMTRPIIPPEITNTFIGADAVIQNILGSFDSTLSKISDTQVSGVAIQESLSLSNSSAMPFVISFLMGWQSMCQNAVDLIPLYYRTPRSIPVMGEDGKRRDVLINQEGGLTLDYKQDTLQVKVEADVSFDIQQTRALEQIIALMNSSPLFAKFMNDRGLTMLLDNVEIRGIDALREEAEKWMSEQLEASQKAMNQPSPEILALQVAEKQVQAEHQVGMARIQEDAAAEQMKAALQMQKLELEKEREITEKQKLQIELIKISSANEVAKLKLGIEQQKADDSVTNKLIEHGVNLDAHAHQKETKNYELAFNALSAITDMQVPEAQAEISNDINSANGEV